MKPMTTTVRRWQETGDAHFYIEKTDAPTAGSDYERKLHVTSAIPNGLHIAISIWGDKEQHHTGINLTPGEAVALLAHIGKVLGHGEWDIAALGESPRGPRNDDRDGGPRYS